MHLLNLLERQVPRRVLSVGRIVGKLHSGHSIPLGVVKFQVFQEAKCRLFQKCPCCSQCQGKAVEPLCQPTSIDIGASVSRPSHYFEYRYSPDWMFGRPDRLAKMWRLSSILVIDFTLICSPLTLSGCRVVIMIEPCATEE